MTINMDGAATNTDLKMNIMDIRLRTMMCPAVMLAKSRTINTKGFVKTPINSTIGINGIGNFNHQGTPGVFTICNQ